MKPTPFLAALALVLGAPAHADRPELYATAGLWTEVQSSKAWDLVDTDDHLPAGRVAAGVVLPLGEGFVDLDLGWRWSTTNATAHTSLTARLFLRGVQVGATYRRPVNRFVHLTGTALGAAEWATLSLSTPSALAQTVFAPSGTGLLGVQVPVPLGRSNEPTPAMTFDVGVGYTLRPTLGFHRLEPTPAKVDPTATEVPLARAAVDLGALPMSGFTWRLQASVRF